MSLSDVHIPTLTTERLTLRPPRHEDVEPFARFYASDAARFVGGPLPDWKVWRYLAGVIGHWAFRGFGRWTVTRTGEDEALGIVGLHHPLDWPEPEIGWMVWVNGRGYGTEAAQAARDWACAARGMTGLASCIDPENKPSIALAQRLGAHPDGHFEHPEFGRLHIWRHPHPVAP